MIPSEYLHAAVALKSCYLLMSIIALRLWLLAHKYVQMQG